VQLLRSFILIKEFVLLGVVRDELDLLAITIVVLDETNFIVFVGRTGRKWEILKLFKDERPQEASDCFFDVS